MPGGGGGRCPGQKGREREEGSGPARAAGDTVWTPSGAPGEQSPLPSRPLTSPLSSLLLSATLRDGEQTSDRERQDALKGSWLQLQV